MKRIVLITKLLLSLVLVLPLGCTNAPPGSSTAVRTTPYTIYDATHTPIPPTRTPTPSPTPTPTPMPTATPTPAPLEIDWIAEPRQIQPGCTLLVRFHSSLPVTVSAFLDAAELSLFAEDDGHLHTALVAVSVWAAAGPRTLSASLRDSLGRTHLVSTTLEVLENNYPTEYIHLLPGREELLAPEITEDEWAYIVPIFNTVTQERLWEGAFITPTTGYVSSRFGTMRSYNDGPVNSYHSGVDISNVTGTTVIAPQRGRVVLAERLRVRGGTVILDHGWGVHSGYLHLSEILVQEGQLVEQGQEIARVGATGLVTGAHLHWEIRLGLTPVDPQEWVRRGDFLY